MRFVLVILLIGTIAAPASAEIVAELRFGHGKQAVAGAITPFVLRLTATDAEKDPISVRMTTTPGTTLGAGEVCNAVDVLAPGTTKEITFLYRPYARTQPEVELEFSRPVAVRVAGGKEPKPTRKITLKAPKPPDSRGSQALSRYTVLTVGPQANVLPVAPDGIRFLPVEEKDLPDVWHAYDGIDAVLLRNPAEEKVIPAGKIEALLRWVEFGGRLVISTRRPDRLRELEIWEYLPADQGAPVIPDITTTELAAPFAPLRAEDRDKAPPQTRGPLYALNLRPDGMFLASLPDLALPLIAQRNHGYGSIAIVAFDTARFRPLGKNRALCFYAALFGGWSTALSTPSPSDCETTLFPTIESFLGGDIEEQPVTDILKLLRAGALTPPPMGLLFLFMVLYILAVGPLDYFVLKRFGLLKWSALTFLGLALIFSVSAWFVSFHLFAGSKKVNRVTFVDIVPGPEGGPDRILIHDLAGHYAPTGARLAIEPEGRTTHVADFTEPDNYRGGGGLQRSPVELTVAGPASVKAQLLIPFRSLRTTRSVITRESTVPLDVTFGPDGPRVSNGLPFDLKNVVVLHHEQKYLVGDLPAGSEARLAEAVAPITYAPLTKMDAYSKETPSPADIRALGPRLQALSWARRGYGPGSREDFNEHFRGLAKFGFDRSPAIDRGVSVVTAWTAERDPFGISEGDADGFTITLIRKVIRP